MFWLIVVAAAAAALVVAVTSAQLLSGRSEVSSSEMQRWKHKWMVNLRWQLNKFYVNHAKFNYKSPTPHPQQARCFQHTIHKQTRQMIFLKFFFLAFPHRKNVHFNFERHREIFLHYLIALGGRYYFIHSFCCEFFWQCCLQIMLSWGKTLKWSIK